MKTQILITLLAATTLALSACKKSDTSAASGDNSGSAEATAASKAPGTAATAKGALTAFKWTEAPTLDAIPSGPPRGIANGVPFAVRSVIIEPTFGKWRITLWDRTLSRPTGIASGGQSINISLPIGPLSSGTKRVKAMKYGDGYFQIAQDPKTPDKTTSWNAKNAYAIEITKWDAKPYDPKGRMFQHAGTASGRIAIVYKGSGSFKNSYAAGTFTNAVVRYMGKPRWKTAEK